MIYKDAVIFCEEFAKTTRPRFVFGVTTHSKDIAKKFAVTGFIDEFTDATSVDGLPVVSWSEVPADAMVVSGIADGRPLTAQKIMEHKHCDCLDFFSFYRYFTTFLNPVAFYHGQAFVDDYHQNKSRYDNVRHKLADALSAETFDKIINFRLTNRLAALEGFTCRTNEQYFDLPFVKDYARHFVDCGGFDGATSLEFARRFPDYKSIQVFEPDISQCQRVAQTLSSLPGVRVYPFGVSDQSETLRFSRSGSASKICDSGDVTIEVVTLDGLLKGDVSCLKMDVEGYELPALAGAQNIIKTQKPLLAICCYHKPDDLWTIPQRVLSYNPDYKIYLRHYSEGLLETVFYFVPESLTDE